MKKLAWVPIFLCVFSSAGLTVDPDASGTSGTAGEASQGAVATRGGMSSCLAIVVIATGLTVATGAVIAAVVSGGNGATPTSTHH